MSDPTATTAPGPEAGGEEDAPLELCALAPGRETHIVDGDRLMAIQSGLRALKEKRLDNWRIETRVSAQYFMLQKAFEWFAERRQALERMEIKAQQERDPEQRRARLADVQTRGLALRSTRFVIPAPKKRLEMKDLPKVFEGDGGQANTLANAGIIIALQPEFFVPPEEPDE